MIDRWVGDQAAPMVRTYQRSKLVPVWPRNKREEKERAHNPFGACLQWPKHPHKALPLCHSTTSHQHHLGIRPLIHSFAGTFSMQTAAEPRFAKALPTVTCGPCPTGEVPAEATSELCTSAREIRPIIPLPPTLSSSPTTGCIVLLSPGSAKQDFFLQYSQSKYIVRDLFTFVRTCGYTVVRLCVQPACLHVHEGCYMCIYVVWYAGHMDNIWVVVQKCVLPPPPIQHDRKRRPVWTPTCSTSLKIHFQCFWEDSKGDRKGTGK